MPYFSQRYSPWMAFGAFFMSVVLAGTILVMLSATSAWYMWSLLPESATTRVVLEDRKGFFNQLGPFLPFITGPDLSSLVSIFAQSKALGVAYSQDAVVIIIKPLWRHQLGIRQELGALGWQTKRVGGLVIAWQGRLATQPRWPTVFKGLLWWPKVTLADQQPGYPFFLMATDRFASQADAEDATLWVAADGEGKEIRLAAHLGYSFSDSFPRKGDLLLPDNATRLSVHVPVTIVRRVLAGATLDRWNDLLIRSFGFVKTHPAIFPSLLIGDSFFIHLRDDGVALGLEDSSQSFISAAQKWLEEEERRNRLVTRAFRLPDGTVGFERVPGEPVSILSLDPSLPQCFGPQDQLAADFGALKESWLCRNGSRVILASNKAMLDMAMHDWPDDFSIVAGQQWLEKLGLPQIQAFSGRFNEDTMQARLFVR